MSQLIIGFGNKARQGKDVAVQAIIDYYAGLRAIKESDYLPSADVPIVQRIGFADALYEVCRTEYGMKEKDAALLQRIGAERRVSDPLYWVRQAFAKIDPKAEVVLVSDVRYKNEADFIKDRGGYVVNVTRLDEKGRRFISGDRPSDHPSETDLDHYNFDFRLVNSDGHQALLAEQAITLVEYLRGLHV
jgi:hypothetical protein